MYNLEQNVIESKQFKLKWKVLQIIRQDRTGGSMSLIVVVVALQDCVKMAIPVNTTVTTSTTSCTSVTVATASISIAMGITA